jgi:Helix-turn-helix domain
MKTLRNQRYKQSPVRYDRLRANQSVHSPKKIGWASPQERADSLKSGYGRSHDRAAHADEVDKTAQRWWVHLWEGLVRDPTGKHYRAIKQAIWLYLYLLEGANWKTGVLFRRTATIATEMGLNSRTIERWLRTLRKRGYIKTIFNGRTLNISIAKWRPVSRKNAPKTDVKV